MPGGPRVSLSARFRPTVGEALRCLPGKAKVVLTLSALSTLWIDGDVTLHALLLDGGLILRVCAGASVKSLTVATRPERAERGGAEW